MPLCWHKPTVASVYDIITLTHPQWCRLSNVWHYRLLLPSTLRRANQVIVPSQQVRQQLVDLLDIAPTKARVVPLGIDPTFQEINNEAALQRVRRRYGLNKDYLLYVGNFTPRKNIPGVVRVFERLAEQVPHDLVLVGGKPHKHWDILRTIEHSSKRSRLHLLGYVSLHDLVALYSGAAAYLYITHYEGFGLTPLEAMACGTPVVVSAGEALPEIAGPGAVIIDSNNRRTGGYRSDPYTQ